jgi:hypothetical protein
MGNTLFAKEPIGPSLIFYLLTPLENEDLGTV